MGLARETTQLRDQDDVSKETNHQHPGVAVDQGKNPPTQHQGENGVNKHRPEKAHRGENTPEINSRKGTNTAI
jgi:hypothetical protein